MKFTKQEYADLHLLYGEARGNSRAARRLYGERFPEGVCRETNFIEESVLFLTSLKTII
jgi:hypothetical protein